MRPSIPAALAVGLGLGCASDLAGRYDFHPEGAAHHRGPLGRDGGSVQGSVFEEEGRAPIDGLVLRLCRVQDVLEEVPMCPLDSPAVVSDSGQFHFDGIPPGEYRLEAEALAARQFSYGAASWALTIDDTEPIVLRCPIPEGHTWLL